MRTVAPITLVVALILTIVILGISAQAYALHKCGFAQTMVYGERAFWAATFGYCDE